MAKRTLRFITDCQSDETQNSHCNVKKSVSDCIRANSELVKLMNSLCINICQGPGRSPRKLIETVGRNAFKIRQQGSFQYADAPLLHKLPLYVFFLD